MDRNLIFPATDPVHTWSVRGIASVRLLVQLGVELGLTTRDCLRRSSISLDCLDDPYCEIEASQELTIVRNLLRHLGHVQGLGFEAGRRYRPSGYGILGYMMLSSRSLRSAIDFTVRNLDLTFAFAHFRTESLPQGYRITLDDGTIPEECRQFLIERDATAVVAIMRQLLQQALPVERIAFRFVRPPYAERIEEFVRGPVAFGAPAHAIVVADEWMDQALPQTDDSTARRCEAQCREILDRRRRRTRVSERVRQLLLQPRAAAMMEGLATELGMAPRTLRRHLGAEGTSFRRLIDEVRATLACELLSQRMTMEEIAERLGYAEPSSFVHAFKRWTGVSPSTYRRVQSDDTLPALRSERVNDQR